MINFNSVYQFVNDGKRMRIIHLDVTSDICLYVYLEQAFSMPIMGSINDMQIKSDNADIVEIADPYFMIKSDKNLKASEIAKRDEAWRIIEVYWDNKKMAILTKHTRTAIFKEISRIENIPMVRVRRIFSRFWQRGMNRNALLPDYAKSGGKGQERILKEKNGRRRIYSNNKANGIIISECIKKQFEAGTNKYWRTNQQKSLRQVYRLILADFYSITVKKNNEIEKIIRDEGMIPTFRQYYYWFKKNENTELDIKMRKGEKEFELKHRSLLSNSTIESPGPGFRFQIDATVADLYIVSEVDRSKIIGRPTVYIIIDVFSRMITGCYVGLESPSWNGAMMVLDSMVADKVELCRKYNIQIESEDWPCCFLPKTIIADRGELEGYGVKNLINNLNITIENTSPYRGDYKGIVERFFRTVNARIKSFLPGAIMKDYRKRGDPDYRLDSKLTLKEITEIILRSVLLHNIHEIEKYPLTPAMIKDNVKPVPLDLWNWGTAHKKGILRKVDRQIFRLNIMPRGKGTISRGTIVFKNLSYGATELLNEHIYKQHKIKTVEIVYDPRNMEQIYWLKEDGHQYITLNLLDKSRHFKDMYLEDVIATHKKAASLRHEARKSQLQQETELDQRILKIAKHARKKTNTDINANISKTKRLKNIGNNRAEEKERNRKIEAFMPCNDNSGGIVPFPIEQSPMDFQDQDNKNLDYNAQMMKKIRQRKEKAKHEKSKS
ncbi:Mu transposase C-terminal domain-containing protein [Pectinatus brassicae]|uniref:Integrase catalytic domain-containing protein n=1 Tax=Pectinatus brassicae TaxID=862415 RepID=A0A840UF55_9FIRM|nr:Mu transposase C-terminal domain-containing protein [Pectinatus brassicae]MBB5335736.1 hypothetical protein [Pectinatus brassicae]